MLIMETEIIEKNRIKLKNGVLITGLPGIGLIGQVVGRYITKELKAKSVATLYSHHFPHQVFMTKKGGMRLIKNTFYLYKGKKRDLLVLVGDVQAMSSVGQYEVAEKILEYSKKVGVKKIITVGGYSTGKITEDKKIFAVATHKEILPKFKKFGVRFGEAKGSIVGIAGLLPALAKIRGIHGICLMGETHGGYVDAVSARNIVKLLSEYFEVKIDLKRLDQRAKESEKMLKKIEDEIQKSMIAPYESPKGVSYIR